MEMTPASHTESHLTAIMSHPPSPSETDHRRARPRAFALIVVQAALVAALACWLLVFRRDLGWGYEWRIRVNSPPLPLGTLLAPALVILGLGGLAAYLWKLMRREPGARARRMLAWAVALTLMLGAFGLQVTLWSIVPSDVPWLVAVQFSRVSTGYLTEAYRIEDLSVYLRTYAREMPSMPEHIATHPPGAVLWFYLIRRAGELLPGLNRAALTAACSASGLTLTDLAAEVGAFPTATWQGYEALATAILASWALGAMGCLMVPVVFVTLRGWVGDERALAAAALMALVPSMLLHFPVLDELIALLGALMMAALAGSLRAPLARAREVLEPVSEPTVGRLPGLSADLSPVALAEGEGAKARPPMPLEPVSKPPVGRASSPPMPSSGVLKPLIVRRGRPALALLAGLIAAAALFVSLGALALVAVGAVFLLLSAVRRASAGLQPVSEPTVGQASSLPVPFGEVVKQLLAPPGWALAAFVTGLGLGLAAWCALGVDVPEVFTQGLTAHSSITGRASSRTYGIWVWLNLIEFGVFLGLPLMVVVIASAPRIFTDLRLRAREALPSYLGAAALVVILLLDLSGLVKGETGRLWLFFAPWLAAAAGPSLMRSSLGVVGAGRSPRYALLIATCALTAFQLLLMAVAMQPLVRPY